MFFMHVLHTHIMFKVSVMYPNEDGARFDLDYYQNNHMKQVEKLMKPYGLIKTSVELGISGGANLPPPYVCIGCLFFETEDGYDRGIGGAGKVLREDIKNYNDIKPVRQMSEIL